MAGPARAFLILITIAPLGGCIPGPTSKHPQVTQPPPAVAAPPTVPLPVVEPAPVAPPPSPAIPAPAWIAAPVTPDAVTIPGMRYTVKPGDTLSRIAEKTGAASDAIARENGLQPPFVVKAGQKIAIPAGRYHLVRRGQSGIAIARAYGVDWSEVATMNRLQPPFILREGQRLLLPSQHEAASMSIEQRAGAFQLDIDDLVTGSEPALAKNEAPAAPSPTATPAKPLSPTAPLAPPTASFNGQFAWPLDGKIIRPFGDFGNGRRNDGVNIAAAQGTPIYAAADGVVAYVGSDVAIYGGLILLRHGENWLTAYGHAERLQVTRGQAVKKGQLIGYVSEAGLSDQDQLHFEVRQGRTPVDPRLHLPKRS